MKVGGYTYQFLDTPPDSLVCRICHCVSREPYLSKCCGHTFCKSCLGCARAAQAAMTVCPMCRSKQFAAFANKQADRAVRCLRVFCTNKKKGCQWQGEVNGVINHLRDNNGCKFKKVACPNDCGVTLQRQHITTHLSTCPYRKAECQFCHTVGAYLLIEGMHKEQCPKFPIGCPNKCEVGSIPRDDVEEHMKICPLGLIYSVSIMWWDVWRR